MHFVVFKIYSYSGWKKYTLKIGTDSETKISASTLEGSEASIQQAGFTRCFTSCAQSYPQILWINDFDYGKTQKVISPVE